MALTQTNDAQAHCSITPQYDYDLTWTPEKNYPAGAVFELRVACHRALSSWQFIQGDILDADVLYRWKTSPRPAERFGNRERKILRGKLQHDAVKGQPVRMTLRLKAPIFAGVDYTLSVWVAQPRRLRIRMIRR